MTLRTLTDHILSSAAALDLVKDTTFGDVYEKWNAQGGHKYGAFHVAIENFSRKGAFISVNYILYYGDRMLPDRSNELELYMDGMNTIQSVINDVENTLELDIDSDYQITPFQQQFSDELAGCYARVSIQIQDVLGLCDTTDTHTV